MVTAHLNLYAVLPAINRYLKLEKGNSLKTPRIGFDIGGWPDGIVLLDHLLSTNNQTRKPALILKFNHITHFNQFMDGRSVIFSVTRGWYRIDQLIWILFILFCLKRYLRPNKNRITSTVQKELYIKNLLCVGLQAVKILSKIKPNIAHRLQKCPDGIVEFNIIGSGAKVWCKLQYATIEYGEGDAPANANVTITFKNPDVAIKVIKGEVDNLSATGLEYIKVRGYIPLADTIGDMLDQVQRYLKP